MKALKIIGVIVGLLIAGVVAVLAFGTSDLRTETAKQNPSEEKARFLLNEMAKAHQIQNWDSISTYTVRFQEEMFGTIGKSSNPFPEAKSQFNLSYIPNTYDGKLSFTDGPNKGIAWGIQSWKTYKTTNGGDATFKKDKVTYFWVPTYQYFVEFPLRIMNANAFGYAGKQTINGKACEGFIASWNTIEPQRHIDQYLVWLDTETKRIVKLEYTVREMYNFLTGAAYYTEYKDFGGIILPTKMPVESNLVSKGKYLHQMDILNFESNTMSVSDLRPDASIKVVGDDKS